MNSWYGYIAAVLTVIFWTSGTFVFTRATRLILPAAVNRVRLVFALVLLSFITCLYAGISPLRLFTALHPQQFLWFALSGIVGLSIGDHFSFTAFKILGSRRASLFNCFAPAAALVTGMILLDETLSVIGIGGMVISASGVLMLSLSNHEKKQVQFDGHGHYTEGIIAGFLAAICQGIGLVLAKKGFMIEGAAAPSAVHATWVRMLAACASIYACTAFKTDVIRELVGVMKNRQHFMPVFLGSIFGPTLGVSCSLYAASRLEVSVAQTIFSLVPVAVMLVSVFFYKEKIRLFSYLAALVSIAGVLILVWRDRF